MVVFDPDTVGCSRLRRVNDQPAGADRLVADATGIDAVIVNGMVIREQGPTWSPRTARCRDACCVTDMRRPEDIDRRDENIVRLSAGRVSWPADSMG